MRHKYIVARVGRHEGIHVFPESYTHANMWSFISRTPNDWSVNEPKLISAGFVTNGQCWGESITLKMSSRGEVDSKLLLPTGDDE